MDAEVKSSSDMNFHLAKGHNISPPTQIWTETAGVPFPFQKATESFDEGILQVISNFLVGGGTSPSETYAIVKLDHLQVGMKISKKYTYHHQDMDFHG